MVEWKNQLESESVGSKAKFMDSIESLNVPNFFVITPDEVESLVNGTRDHDRVLNSQLQEEIKKRIKDAYKDIGMSSEVRNASGRAKNLVGGQRDTQMVSVRVSGRNMARYDYKLNVGSSEIFQAIKEVVASYYEENNDNPAIIVQKMVESDYTGAALTDYLGDYGLIEVVEGSGISLEEGLTQPHYYLLDSENRVQQAEKADKQLKITRNPITGQNRRKEVDPSSVPFSREEVEEFFADLRREDLNVKFAYKRGSFHIIDAWSSRPERTRQELNDEIEGIRVSTGEIEGIVGRDITYSERTLPPSEYQNALISTHGGYSSRDAQKARLAEKPAVFGFKSQVSQGESIRIADGTANISESSGGNELQRRTRDSNEPRNKVNPFTNQQNSGGSREELGVAAAEILPLNSGNKGVFLSPPFGNGYAVTDYDVEAETFSRDEYLTSYEEVFGFKGEKAILDTRKLGGTAIAEAAEYIDGELKIMVLDQVDPEVIKAGVENGFDVFAAPNSMLERVEKAVARAEKQFILEKVRDL